VKVAILGANGQLGSNLVKAFGKDAIPLTHRDLDITEPGSVQILKELKPDVVINTAAYVRVDDAEVEAEKAFQVNAIGALNVAKACNELLFSKKEFLGIKPEFGVYHMVNEGYRP